MGSELSSIVLDRYQRASAMHGDLCIQIVQFEAHLQRILDRYLGPNRTEDLVLSLVLSLHTNDLFLALSCAKGNDSGWRRFHALYGKYLADLSRHLLGGPDREEVGQTIWIDLFLPDRSGQSRIASYDGRSSLATWLRVVVSNRIINERQRRNFCSANIENIPEPADPRALQKVESRLGSSRYENAIVSAFEKALASLNHRDALIVLLRYDQGLQLGEIARLYAVHQSTITRQLDRAIERLRADVIERLTSDYGLDRNQVDECMSVASDAFAGSFSILAFIRKHALSATSSVSTSALGPSPAP
jgi:RNA polymerase sigma-70 factor